MGRNEAEMKSEDKSCDREEEIDLKVQICENSMKQNEALMKSKEKSGDRENELELKSQLCEN